MTDLSRQDKGLIRQLIAERLTEDVAMNPPPPWGERPAEWRAYVEEIARQISPAR